VKGSAFTAGRCLQRETLSLPEPKPPPQGTEVTVTTQRTRIHSQAPDLFIPGRFPLVLLTVTQGKCMNWSDLELERGHKMYPGQVQVGGCVSDLCSWL
jgi:hypothetical protein